MCQLGTALGTINDFAASVTERHRALIIVTGAPSTAMGPRFWTVYESTGTAWQGHACWQLSGTGFSSTLVLSLAQSWMRAKLLHKTLESLRNVGRSYFGVLRPFQAMGNDL